MAEGLLEFTDDSFEADVLKADKPVLVDFWATWCGPCKALTPTIEKLAGEFAGRMIVGKMDIGTHPQTAGKFGMKPLPARPPRTRSVTPWRRSAGDNGKPSRGKLSNGLIVQWVERLAGFGSAFSLIGALLNIIYIMRNCWF